jgi:hypothetical protein
MGYPEYCSSIPHFVTSDYLEDYNTVLSWVGRDISVSIATRKSRTVRGSNPGGSEIFHTGPDRFWGPPAYYTMSTGSFPGVKRPGSGADHPSSSSAEVNKRVELLHLWAFVACYMANFPTLVAKLS